MKALAKINENVSDVVPHEDAGNALNIDEKPYARLGWFVVLFGFLGFVLWASLAPLDQGVPLAGNVAVSTNRKMVQHQLGGTLEEIFVKEGDHVSAGQILVRMNSVQAKSNLETARSQYYSAKATEARLLAERGNSSVITFPKVLLDAKADPRVSTYLLTQEQLFAARRSALQGDLSVTDETIAGLKMQLTGMEESMAGKKQQLAFLKEQLDGMRDLAKDGYVARNRLLDAERNYTQMGSAISEDLGNIGRIKRQLSELEMRKSLRQQEYQKEVRTILSDVQKECESLGSRIAALEYEFQSVEVKAPVSGTVVGLNVFTVGGVVPGGFKLMELVPDGDNLIIEGQLPVNLIDKVHKDLPVELIFSAFNSAKTPHIPGIVTQVSADRTVDERTGMPYYKVRAAVAPDGMKQLAKLQIRPGMPVEMVVKTGERTMMNYLLKPILNRAETAFTEE